MVVGKDVCLRRLAKGNRAREVRFNRFLGNAKVTTAALIEGWSEGTAAAAESRPILAIQDTSAINFATTARRRRGLVELGKGDDRVGRRHPLPAREATTVGAQRSVVLLAARYGGEGRAVLELGFGAVDLARAEPKSLRHLPESLPRTLVEVRQSAPQDGTEPLHWRLLPTHPVAN